MTEEARPLHVYTDDTDTVIAESEADALAVWKEHTGADDHGFDHDDGKFELVPDDREIRIWCDGDGYPDDQDAADAQVVARTAAEWCAHQGRGFLCSTEY